MLFQLSAQPQPCKHDIYDAFTARSAWTLPTGQSLPAQSELECLPKMHQDQLHDQILHITRTLSSSCSRLRTTAVTRHGARASSSSPLCRCVRSPQRANVTGIVFLFLTSFHDEGDVALLANKQNQCWSASQMTISKRVSDEVGLLLKKNKQRHNVKHCTKSSPTAQCTPHD